MAMKTAGGGGIKVMCMKCGWKFLTQNPVLPCCPRCGGDVEVWEAQQVVMLFPAPGESR